MRVLKVNETLITMQLCAMIIIGRIAFDLYLPALPLLQQEFHTTAHEIQLTVSYCAFGFGISQLFYGPLSDHFGRRRILLGGMLIFIVGSVLSYLASNTNQHSS